MENILEFVGECVYAMLTFHKHKSDFEISTNMALPTCPMLPCHYLSRKFHVPDALMVTGPLKSRQHVLVLHPKLVNTEGELVPNSSRKVWTDGLASIGELKLRRKTVTT